MKKTSKIYVAGHTGLVGSAIKRKLKELSYARVITKTHKELDLASKKNVESFFLKEKPEFVFLAAAKVGGIHANKTFPAEFIYQNLMIQANVIDAAFKYKAKKLLFLSSSCVYPKKCRQPMKEEHLMTDVLEPTNEPYGLAKLAGMGMCQSYNKQYGTNFICAIPANTYGINDNFSSHGHVLASLIRKFHIAKVKSQKCVELWGTGKPKRDFLFADNLAEACILLMKKYKDNEVINIGSGKDTSIKELAQVIKKVTGYKGDLFFDRTKPDGNPQRSLDGEKMKVFGWEPTTSLEEGIKKTYLWYKKNNP
tara:strand:+ start:1141 stop:2067 length:927 start_codon:yes stop_codon:yes gene_type:complete